MESFAFLIKSFNLKLLKDLGNPQMSSEIDFKIQVGDSNNHVPVVLAPPSVRIDENSPLGTFVANVSFSDDDPCWVNKMGEVRVVGDFAENFRIEDEILSTGSK